MAKLRPQATPVPPGPVPPGEARRPAPDPRWVLSPQAARIAAHRYFLIAGQHADVRLPGWVALAQQGQHDEPTVEDVWARYRTDLIAEADAYGFQPYALTNKQPSGEGFERWSAAFLARHRY